MRRETLPFVLSLIGILVSLAEIPNIAYNIPSLIDTPSKSHIITHENIEKLLHLDGDRPVR
jgi:hypothetical protein